MIKYNKMFVIWIIINYNACNIINIYLYIIIDIAGIWVISYYLLHYMNFANYKLHYFFVLIQIEYFLDLKYTFFNCLCIIYIYHCILNNKNIKSFII